MKFYIYGADFFENLSRKFTLLSDLTVVTGTVREDLCKLFSRILRRMGNVSHKSCRENRDKHSMFGTPPLPPRPRPRPRPRPENSAV